MRITTITTLDHNIGDDLVREGILYLLDQALGESATYSHIHKHIPLTVRPHWEWVYSCGLTKSLGKTLGTSGMRLSLAIDSLMPRMSDKISSADVVVQCGTPIFWKNLYSSGSTAEWIAPLLRRRVAKPRKPFLNLAGGTCLGYHSSGQEIQSDAGEMRFVRWYLDLAKLTTVRDSLSANIAKAAGRDATLLPCTSLFARDRWRIEPGPPEYVVLNIMPKGGHYNLDGNVQESDWAAIYKSAVERLNLRHPCLFVCHTRAEEEFARKICPSVKTFFSTRFNDYLAVFARAKFGLVNRVHAAFAIASFGRPSFVIGNDTRARMVEFLNLRHAYVGDVIPEDILGRAEQLERQAENYGDEMHNLRTRTRQAYVSLLQGALKSIPRASPRRA